MNRDDKIEAVAREVAAHRCNLHNRQAFLGGSRKPAPPSYSIAKAAIEAYEKTLPTVEDIEKVLVFNTEITGSGYFANSKQAAQQIHNLIKGVK